MLKMASSVTFDSFVIVIICRKIMFYFFLLLFVRRLSLHDVFFWQRYFTTPRVVVKKWYYCNRLESPLHRGEFVNGCIFKVNEEC